jgi:wyosine [tRNA(Phe)-imidazoG37] synthetase (radical SAM superfamily)
MRNKYIFGPVPSRRLGSSLGVDIIPSKICTLDCVYCEVGRTTDLSSSLQTYFDPADIIEEFAREYAGLKNHIDVVTVTGSGEPTLNSGLAEIASGIKKISKHPLAVLTNSTMITEKSVRDALKLFDIIIPSVDAATQEIFEKVNRPKTELSIEAINDALVSFTNEFTGKVLIETLLVKGMNDSDAELEKITDVIKRCRYDLVQLNTVFRPPAYSHAKGLEEQDMLSAFLKMKSLGLNVEPVGNFIKKLGGPLTDNPAEKILSLLRMRPCTLKDIADVFGLPEETVEAVANGLLKKKLIEEKIFKGDRFYFGSE